jgi:heptosyltransferase-2
MLPLCSLLGAQRIIGTSGINKGLDTLLTDSMPYPKQHEIVRRLQLIEKMGAKRHTEELSFFLQPEEQVIRPKNKPRVAIHPGSKDNFKRWPAGHFIQVGQKLAKLGVEVCITGSKQEKALMQQIAASIPEATLLNPTLTLRQFAAELEHFDLLISNDTGPVHLACALHVPVIALYSPTNPSLCGPHQAKRALTIAKPITCEPCLKRKCRRPFCLLQIGPEEVIDRATQLLFS